MSKTVRVKTDIIINQPIEKVAQYASDPNNATTWYINIKSSTLKTPLPLKIGSLIEFKAQFMGKKLEYTYEIMEMDPMKKFTMRTAQGPFPMETMYSWEAIDSNTTRMTLENRGTPKGFSMLFAPLMTSMMRKANNKDLKKLKSILEA